MGRFIRKAATAMAVLSLGLALMNPLLFLAAVMLAVTGATAAVVALWWYPIPTPCPVAAASEEEQQQPADQGHQPRPTRRVAVVAVGGDFARSPRMQYHAVSLAKSGRFTKVRCVGEDHGNKLCEQLRQLIADGRAEFMGVAPLQVPAKTPWVLRTIIRVLHMVGAFAAVLWWATDRQSLPTNYKSSEKGVNSNEHQTTVMVGTYEPHTLVLMQSPPAIPFAWLVSVVCWARERFGGAGSVSSEVSLSSDKKKTGDGDRAISGQASTKTKSDTTVQKRGGIRIVVDVHNFGYTLLECDKRPRWAVSLYHALERRHISRGPSAWLTVSDAMARQLCGGAHTNALHPANDAAHPPSIPSTSTASTSKRSRDKKVAKVGRGSGAAPTISKAGFYLSSSSVSVVPDCPPSFFEPCSRRSFHDAVIATNAEAELSVPRWFSELCLSESDAAPSNVVEREQSIVRSSEEERNCEQQGYYRSASKRDLVIVSATSWTADDDYTMVVDALKLVNDAIAAAATRTAAAPVVAANVATSTTAETSAGTYDDASPPTPASAATGRCPSLSSPTPSDSLNLNLAPPTPSEANLPLPEAVEAPRRVWLVATGKGVARPRFEAQVAAANLNPEFVSVSTCYFQSYAHYAKMLGASDVGLCVHASSSGWDLPMKCVDMLGSGLPVLALGYEALEELVTAENGWVFNSAERLARNICGLIGLQLPSTMSKDCSVTTHASSSAAHAAVEEKECRREDLLEKRRFVYDHCRKHWDETWAAKAAPVLLS